MKTKLTAIALLTGLLGFGSQVLATENQGLNKVDLDQIHAACKQESQGAENPQWYAEECAADRIHALRVERGLEKPKQEKDEG